MNGSLRNDEAGRALEFHAAGETLWRYQYDGYDFHPHFHPIRLPGSPDLTLVRPGDHPWHNGLYFSWKYLNGRNVWDQPAAQPHGGVRHAGIEVLTDGFLHRSHWVDEAGVPMLLERRMIRPDFDTARGLLVIDWTSTFEAAEGEVVCERELKWGGYAGLSLRCARGSAPVFTTPDGGFRGRSDASPRACWVDFTFNPDGLPSRTWHEHHFGFTLMDAPMNPGHPVSWLLYGDMQKVNAALVQRAPMVIRPGVPLLLRYRIVVHRGAVERSGVEDWWQEWAGQG